MSTDKQTRSQQQTLGAEEARPSTQEPSREEDWRDFQTEESLSHGRKKKGIVVTRTVLVASFPDSNPQLYIATLQLFSTVR